MLVPGVTWSDFTTSSCFLMVTMCDSCSAWDLHAPTACCSSRVLYCETVSSLPVTKRCFDFLHFHLKCIWLGLFGSAGSSPGHRWSVLQSSGTCLAWSLKWRRLRGEENKVLSRAWRCLLSKCHALPHFLEVNVFPSPFIFPKFNGKTQCWVFIQNQFLGISLPLLFLLAWASPGACIAFQQSIMKQFHYTDTGLKKKVRHNRRQLKKDLLNSF